MANKNTKVETVYFLVAMSITPECTIHTDEMVDALQNVAQPDEEQGFVKVEAWQLIDPMFEGRVGSRGQSIHRDQHMLRGISGVTIGAVVKS
jgi:hypothetical protein